MGESLVCVIQADLQGLHIPTTGRVHTAPVKALITPKKNERGSRTTEGPREWGPYARGYAEVQGRRVRGARRTMKEIRLYEQACGTTLLAHLVRSSSPTQNLGVRGRPGFRGSRAWAWAGILEPYATSSTPIPSVLGILPEQ